MIHLPSVTIVTVNWNRPRLTKECLRSVFESWDVNIDVVVIDNGSEDNSASEILSAFPSIDLIQLHKNIGFSGGFNAGIERALAKGACNILLANNDTIFTPDAIITLLDSEYEITIPKILYLDSPSTIWAAGARWRNFPPGVVLIGFGKKDGVTFNRPMLLDYATGCVLMVKRDVFEKVKGFDQKFENYLEDYDFFFRVREVGFRIEYQPKAIVYHKVSQSLGEASPKKWRYLGRNTVFFFRKNNRFPNWMLWTHLGWVTIRETVRGNLRSTYYYWQGVLDGLVQVR